MIIILIGPMGSGKTTIGKILARKLDCPFEDADDFHPPENVSKMSKGTPLEDSDRIGWLNILKDHIRLRRIKNEDLVLACSALKQSYRDLLGVNQKDIISVYLKGSFKLLAERVSKRNHGYMHKGLLKSQMATMEIPKDGLMVDIRFEPDVIIDQIIKQRY